MNKKSGKETKKERQRQRRKNKEIQKCGKGEQIR